MSAQPPFAADGTPVRELTLPASDGQGMSDWFMVLARRWKLVVVGPVLGAVLAYGGSFLLTPIYTARTSILPPQQQSAASSALASLSGLANLAGVGAGAGLRSPTDQYVGLLQSQTIEARLVERFKLKEVYRERLDVDARTELEKRTRVSVGKRDGIIVVEVDDADPKRAAELSNEYIEELRRLTSTLAVSEAQQRRVFFEGLLTETKNKLAAAQNELELAGVSSGTLRSEPKAAAETYAKLKAQVTAAEIRLQSLRTELTDGTAEVRVQLAELNGLRSRLTALESDQKEAGGSDYVGRYRNFKYQETLFELFARQYELARVDESREGALIQVVDKALVPEKRSWPRRSLLALAGMITGFLLSVAFVLGRHFRGAEPAH